MTGRLLAVVLTGGALGLSLSACGQVGEKDAIEASSTPAEATTTQPVAAYDYGSFDWANPMDGVAVDSSLGELRRAFPFEVKAPELGQLIGTYVSRTQPSDPPDFQQVQFVYDSVEFGRLVVIEHHPSLPGPEAYAAYEKEMVAASERGELGGTATIVTLADGTDALYETAPDESSSSINWYVSSETGDYEVIVLAPKLDVAQAVDVADRF